MTKVVEHQQGELPIWACPERGIASSQVRSLLVSQQTHRSFPLLGLCQGTQHGLQKARIPGQTPRAGLLKESQAPLPLPPPSEEARADFRGVSSVSKAHWVFSGRIRGVRAGPASMW